jgi:hypothetical protein
MLSTGPVRRRQSVRVRLFVPVKSLEGSRCYLRDLILSLPVYGVACGFAHAFYLCSFVRCITVAKVMQDWLFENWQFSEPSLDLSRDIGSGYPSDPKCKNHMIPYLGTINFLGLVGPQPSKGWKKRQSLSFLGQTWTMKRRMTFNRKGDGQFAGRDEEIKENGILQK